MWKFQGRGDQKMDVLNRGSHSIYIGTPPPLLRGLFIIPLGYKNFRTPLDAIFGSYPMDIFIPPLGYRFWISLKHLIFAIYLKR
jgi:hypothetical protein